MSLDASTTLVCGRTVTPTATGIRRRAAASSQIACAAYPGDHEMPGQPQASPARSRPARRPRARRQPGAGSRARARSPGHVARPLPDPVAIRLCLVPDTAPPYDDEAPASPGRAGRADALAAAIVAALGRATGPRALGCRRRPEAAPAVGRAEHAGTGRPPPAAAPERPPAAAAQRDPPGRMPGRSARAGPASSRRCWPRRWPDPGRQPAQRRGRPNAPGRTYASSGPLLTAGQRPLVQRVITSAPSAGVVEMTVVVGFGPRVRALPSGWSRRRRDRATGHPPGRPVALHRGEAA